MLMLILMIITMMTMLMISRTVNTPEMLDKSYPSICARSDKSSLCLNLICTLVWSGISYKYSYKFHCSPIKDNCDIAEKVFQMSMMLMLMILMTLNVEGLILNKMADKQDDA